MHIPVIVVEQVLFIVSAAVFAFPENERPNHNLLATLIATCGLAVPFVSSLRTGYPDMESVYLSVLPFIGYLVFFHLVARHVCRK